MSFFTSLSPSFNKYVHIPNRNPSPAPIPYTYFMPNSTSPYPPEYPTYNIVDSQGINRNGEIYSGIEPLASISASPQQLTALFNSTSEPGTSAMLYNPSRKQRRLYNRYQPPSPLGVLY